MKESTSQRAELHMRPLKRKEIACIAAFCMSLISFTQGLIKLDSSDALKEQTDYLALDLKMPSYDSPEFYEPSSEIYVYMSQNLEDMSARQQNDKMLSNGLLITAAFSYVVGSLFAVASVAGATGFRKKSSREDSLPAITVSETV